MNQEKILNITVALLIALLSWGIFSIHQLSVSTASLSKSVEYLVVENLPARVTTLEVLMQEVMEGHEKTAK